MTMERRYQIFVSSTFRDLQEERQQVIQALLELDCLPAGMELFPASDEEKWQLIRRVIDDCDYYVVIIGGRYGSVDETGLSYTEREYDHAIAAKIPVLAFLHAQPDAIPAGKTELDPTARARLDAFREKAQHRMCRYYKTPEELGGLVSRGLVQAMKLTPSEGWVHARYASSPEEVNSLRARIDELNAQLQQARTEPPPGVELLAHGSEKLEIRFIYDTHSLRNKHYTIALSWDQIFACVGPTMFDEAPEEDLRSHLRQKMAAETEADKLWALKINEEDFQTIKCS